MKLTTKNTYLDNLFLGILAGFSIALGGTLNIMCVASEFKFLGSLSFCVGLLLVCFCGFHLFTGKVGYVFENKKRFIFSLIIMYIGNFIGAAAFGYILMATGFANTFSSTVDAISSKKLIDLGSGFGQSWITMFGLSFLCCNLVFLAVDIFKKNKNIIIKILN